MAKVIKKKDCKFKNGYIVKKNKIVGVPYAVYMELEKLELCLQQYVYLKNQAPFCPGPSLDGFERTSALNSTRPYVDMPDTPVMDKRVEEAMEFMEEVDAVNDAKEINKAINKFGVLIDFCNQDWFIDSHLDKQLDLPMLGNPMTLTAESVVAAIKMMITNPIIMAEL